MNRDNLHDISYKCQEALANEDQEKIDELLEKYPEDFLQFYLDDGLFMSSEGYLTISRSEGYFMGAGLHLICQDGQRFSGFLYPSHARTLREALNRYFEVMEKTDANN